MSPNPGSPASSALPSPQHVPGSVSEFWPGQPEFLTDTSLCPACFAPIAIAPRPTVLEREIGPVCTACGLDLGVPEAVALLNAGSAVVFAESQRRELLARIRSAQVVQEGLVAEARAAATVPLVPTYRPEASAPPQGFVSPAPVVSSYPPDRVHPQPGPPAQPALAKQRRSGIQILMLAVGVILVAIMALFFVLLAYLVASLEVRSVLTGTASVAVFGVAVLLLRRRLQGTAEGIAALAVVLFLLDLWIIRANGVFGSSEVDGWLYTGLSAGALSLLLALASRVFALRTLSLSAVLLGPVACFALVLGALVDVDAWTRVWTALIVVGFGSLIWIRISRPTERAVLRAGGMLAAVVAGICAFGAFPDLAVGGSIAFAVLAGVWFCMLAVSPARQYAVHADAAVPVRFDVWDSLAAVGLGLAASGVGVSLFLWGRVEDAILWLPATATAIAALVLASLVRVPELARLVPALRLAALIPLGVAGLSSAPALAFSVATSAWGARADPFSVSAFGSPANPLVQMSSEPPLGLVLVSAIAVAALASLGRAHHWSWLPAGVGGLGLVAASASIGQPAASALCLGLLAAALLAGIVVLASAPLRIALGTVFAAAVVVLGTIGLSSTATFPVTTVATVVLLAAARQVIVQKASAPVAAALAPMAAGAAAVAAVLGARMVPDWFGAVTGASTGTGAPAVWMAVAALMIGAAVPFAAGLLGRAESAVLASVAALAAGSGLAELYDLANTGPLLAGVAVAAFACVAWQLAGRVADWPERFVAAAVAPLAFLWAVEVAWHEFGWTLPSGAGPAESSGVGLAAMIVLLAALGPVFFRRRNGRAGTSPARIAWDSSLAIAAVLTLASVSIHPQLGWLALLLLAVAALLVASGDGDIAEGSSRRRHLAWLGLPFAVAGLWLGLARAGATVVEFYTLPVAGLLLAILGITLARRPVADALVRPGRTALFAAALAVGIAPSAVVATAAEPLRAGIVLGVSALAIAAGALVSPVLRGLRVGCVIWLAGVLGATVTGLGRSVLGPDEGTLPFEIWSAAGGVLLLAAGMLWHVERRAPGILATVAVVASVVVFTLPTLGALLTSDVDAWRGLLVLGVACGFVLAASVRGEFSPELRWVAIVCAVALGGALVVIGTADPFELATVPLALALIIGGGVRLHRDSSRSSWAELGPGLVVLLLPSLAANFGFSNELWRVVALGVVALVVLGTGLALKLQAPTILGAVVVVVHALAQLWPWISGLYGSVPWWLWAGIGGVILIVLAATYESRIRDLKAVARGLSSLR